MDIRIVPEWNVKLAVVKWLQGRLKLESYQSGM